MKCICFDVDRLRPAGRALLAALLCATVVGAHGDVVIFDALGNGVRSISPRDGAKLSEDGECVLVETKRSDGHPGFSVSGKWDVSGCSRIEIELECGEKLDFCLSLRNPGGKPGAEGGRVYALKSEGAAREVLSANFLSFKAPASLAAISSRLKPVRVWAFPYAAGVPSDVFLTRRISPVGSGDVDLGNVAKVSLYLKKPRKAVSWKVKRIVAKEDGPALCEPQAWTRLSEDEFFPFIDRYGQFRHKDWPDKIHSDADFERQRLREAKDLEENPGPGGWDKWGGWADGPQLSGKGGFYTTKWNGKWWIVDPDGHLWWSHGPVRVTPSSGITPLATPDGDRAGWFYELPSRDDPVLGAFYETRDELMWPHHLKRGIDKVYDFSCANIRRKYGEKWFECWSDIVHRRLRSWGCNTLANSSDRRICLMGRTPYTERYEVHARAIAGHKGGWWDFCDPFDPSFRSESRRMTEVYREQFEDPWCIGFFVDNEHNWGEPHTLGLSTLKSPADQPCKRVFRDRLMAKYGEISKLNGQWKTDYPDWESFLRDEAGPKEIAGAREDLESFSAEIADAYYRIINEEMKKANPNKLYLGCRWAGRPPEFTVRAAARHCDVISYNIYKTEISGFRLPDGVDAPVLIGEFHFGALDRGPFCPGLLLLRDQKQRADTYREYVESALRHPQIVGAQWHQLSDQPASGRFDGENMQVGWTDICDTPYWETVQAVREVGSDMYGIRAGRDMKTLAPPSPATLHAVKGVSPAVFYGASHAVEDGDSTADLAVIVVHGWGGGAKERSTKSLVGDLSSRGAKPYVVTPMFPRRSVLKKADVPDDGRAVWGDSWEVKGAAGSPVNDWRGGGDAIGTSLSSFDVVDGMIGTLCDKTRYPALKRIVLAGFSAGGQFVGRYAAVGRCPLREGMDMAFAVIAPSTELRLDPEASWHYGLKDRPRYSAALADEAIRANLASRRVWRGCGTEDVKRGSLDVAPIAMRQGANRYERYLNFKEYVKGFPDWSAKVSFHDIPGVGHSEKVFRDAALLDFIVSGDTGL